MKTIQCWVCCALLALVWAASVQAQTGTTGDGEKGAATGSVPKALVGSWKAEPERTALATDFDVSVWGQGASAVRDVELVVAPSGEATLTVTRKVVDPRGRVKLASTSIEEARLIVGAAQETTGPRIEHAVTVVKAERRFPDDPKDIWPIDGLRVRVVSFSDNAGTIEVRFDTPEGRGSFWQMLGKASSRRR